MIPYEWVRRHPGAVIVITIGTFSFLLTACLPLSGTKMLENENTMQWIGIILAGQLAVLALTVPAVLELRGKVLDSPEGVELYPMLDGLIHELKSNTLCTFISLALVFFSSTAFEARPDWLLIGLPKGLTVDNAFCAMKMTLVTISGLAMWDSIEPLFGIGEAMTALKKMAEATVVDKGHGVSH